jgi:hypothetical protein
MRRKDFEAQIKAFQAETQRISTVQASMSPEIVQEIVMGTVHGMITSGDLVGEMPSQQMDVGMQGETPMEQPQ